ncbi:NAD(P)-dependent oxidoreductase, partial [Burkholderia multivorans]|uniref:NAD(P)-dependent oxidoreductase n=1 Tax=Burkholderia multivorans TaxID=87883 RepID=UPI00325F96AE
FGMRLVGYDPYITQARAAQMGVEVVDLPGLLAVSDFVTVHMPKTPETIGMIGAEQFAQAKPGARFVNVARGGHYRWAPPSPRRSPAISSMRARLSVGSHGRVVWCTVGLLRLCGPGLPAGPPAAAVRPRDR